VTYQFFQCKKTQENIKSVETRLKQSRKSADSQNAIENETAKSREIPKKQPKLCAVRILIWKWTGLAENLVESLSHVNNRIFCGRGRLGVAKG